MFPNMGSRFHFQWKYWFPVVVLFSLHITQKTKSSSKIEVYVSLNSVALQFALIWFFCYHSALVSERMNEVSDVAYSLPWHCFSLNTQKYIILILRQSNKEFVYRGLGILRVNMETLKMVSYFIDANKVETNPIKTSHSRWSTRLFPIIYCWKRFKATKFIEGWYLVYYKSILKLIQINNIIIHEMKWRCAMQAKVFVEDKCCRGNFYSKVNRLHLRRKSNIVAKLRI